MSVELVPFTRIYLEYSFEWLHNPILLKLIDAGEVTREEQEKWFYNLSNDVSYRIWGISLNGRPIGACGIKHIFNMSGELFCYIGVDSLWGKGYGKEILRLIEEKSLILGLVKITLKVLNENLRAITLYKKVGYLETGVDEKYLYMEKFLELN